jgi:beta-fructofuranosidase
MAESRPRHHITPAVGWLNDPNGLSCVDGRYHVFHQFNPDATTWGPPQWGHLSSNDLVQWTRQGIALTPTAGPDAGGCWSGCVVSDHGLPTAVYTGVQPLDDGWTQTVCLSRGDEALRSWYRDAASPVVAGPPPDYAALGFRDPFVWHVGDGWAMVVGSGTRSRGGSALLFTSGDLVHWQYVGPILEAADLDRSLGPMGLIWECPQLVPIGDRHLLLYSLWDEDRPDPRGYSMPELHHSVAILGEFDGRRFLPTSVERFDHGPDHYAPAVLREPDGRLLVWGWSWEALTDAGRAAQGWAGALTLPRVIGIDSDRLTIDPAPELLGLRGHHVEIRSVTLGPGRPSISLPLAGDVLDIEATFRAGGAARFGLLVRQTPDGHEQTVISYDPLARLLEVDRTRSSVMREAVGDIHAAPLELDPGGELDFRVIIDRSVVEVFANRRRVITTRVYPWSDDALGVRAFADGGNVELVRAAVWDLGDRQTSLPST